MYEIKKILFAFLTPPGIFVLLLLILSLYYLVKNNKKRFIIFFSFFVFLYVISINFFFNLFICSLERKINKNASINGDVIVFLSATSIRFNDLLLNSDSLSLQSLARLFGAYRVYKKTDLPIILTGGKIYDFESDAEIGYKILLSLGVPREKIYYENKSLNTYENAKYSKEICDKNNFKKPVLVTESIHIPRSVYIFKKLGFKEVSFYPTSYICSNRTTIKDFLPDDFYNQKKVFYELIGYLYYKIIY